MTSCDKIGTDLPNAQNVDTQIASITQINDFDVKLEILMLSE